MAVAIKFKMMVIKTDTVLIVNEAGRRRVRVLLTINICTNLY